MDSRHRARYRSAGGICSGAAVRDHLRGGRTMSPRLLRNGFLLPGLLLAALSLSAPAAKAAIDCTASVGNQQNLRQEGTTEPVADILLTCNGSLSQVEMQSQSVIVTTSVPITSRILG